MKKRILLWLAATLLLNLASVAQTVRMKDRWGQAMFYMTENTVQQKDRWGEKLLWYDSATQQVRQKDRWGQPLIYME